MERRCSRSSHFLARSRVELRLRENVPNCPVYGYFVDVVVFFKVGLAQSKRLHIQGDMGRVLTGDYYKSPLPVSVSICGRSLRAKLTLERMY